MIKTNLKMPCFIVKKQFCAFLVILGCGGCFFSLPAPGANVRPVPAFGITGYHIPVIDLSLDQGRIVSVDRENGQYLGHPTTVLLPDGKTIYAVYPKGHAAGALVLKRSDDGGMTWSDRLPVPENWKTSKNPPSIHRLEGPDGKSRLIVLTGSAENKKEDLPVRMSVSEDDGRTWTPLAPIGDGVEYNAIVAASCMLRLKDGRYMTLHHSDYLSGPEGRRNMKLYKMLSPDGGQIAVLIRDNSRFRRGVSQSYIIFSNDEGETWTPARALPPVLAGDKHVAKYAPEGRLVIVFRDMDFASPTRGHFMAWIGTHEDLLKNGNGQYRVKLLNNFEGADCGHAGLELLPDGTFVAVTYVRDVLYVRDGKRSARHSVVSVRFRLDELDRLVAKGR